MSYRDSYGFLTKIPCKRKKKKKSNIKEKEKRKGSNNLGNGSLSAQPKNIYWPRKFINFLNNIRGGTE